MLKKGKNGVYLRPVGEVFRYKDKLLEVVRADGKGCEKCYFKYNFAECTKSYPYAGVCSRPLRTDCYCNFREVKVDTAYAGNRMRAVGSYFTCNGKLLRVERPQSHKVCDGCAFRGTNCFTKPYFGLTGPCAGLEYTDEEKNVIFREVKVETDVAEIQNENENQNEGGNKDA